MIRSLSIVFVVCIALVSLSKAQATTFPGLNAAVKRDLAAVKRSMPFPLPTWVPSGFTLVQVHKVLGSKVKIEDKQLILVYSRKLADGRLQRFAFEAGFDGLGDLMYGGGKRIKTSVGTVTLLYRPKDEDGKKMMDFAMTEWFDVGKTAFHYVGVYGTGEEDGDKLTMISQADTERMLRSLRRY